MNGKSTRPLIVAPMARELRPLLARIEARRVEELPFGSLFEGEWRGTVVSAAVMGDGRARFLESLEALAGRVAAERVLLVGVAGGLSPDLGVGEIVRPGRVLDPERSLEWTSTGAGTVVTVPRILGAATEKAALWDRLGRPAPASVDLESAWLAEWGTSRSLDWTVIRAVSDPQGEDLPLDFASASDAGGHVVGAKVARQIAARPSSVSALADLRRRVGLCADRLCTAGLDWLGEGPA